MNFMRAFSYSLLHLCGVVAAGDVDLALVQRTVNTYTLGALAQKQRQQHQLGVDFSTKGTMYTLQYKISKFQLTSECQDFGSSELTAFGKVNDCSTGCVQGDSNGNANSWVRNGNWCERTINTTSPTLNLEFEAWEDDKGGRCDYNNGDDCHSQKKMTTTLNPSTSWAEIVVHDSFFAMTVNYKLTEITPTPNYSNAHADTHTRTTYSNAHTDTHTRTTYSNAHTDTHARTHSMHRRIVPGVRRPSCKWFRQ